MKRDEALILVKDNVTNKNLFKHCLAVEAIMRGVAQELNFDSDIHYDEEKWAMAGLVHDIDYDLTVQDPEKHAIEGARMLQENGFSEDIIYAVKAHNSFHGLELKSSMDIALFAADPLSGLIVAAALISPDKKLRSIDKKFVINRFNEKLFAKGANRDQVMTCTKLGLSLERFVDIALSAMQSIDEALGL